MSRPLSAYRGLFSYNKRPLRMIYVVPVFYLYSPLAVSRAALMVGAFVSRIVIDRPLGSARTMLGFLLLLYYVL